MTMPQHESRSFKVIRTSNDTQHDCYKPPRYDSRYPFIGVGTKIQCETCGTVWECVARDYGSQRDPIDPPALKWNRVYR